MGERENFLQFVNSSRREAREKPILKRKAKAGKKAVSSQVLSPVAASVPYRSAMGN